MENKMTITKYRNQRIFYTGDGLYKWDKTSSRWDRLEPFIERGYTLANDKRSFGLVKLFTEKDIIIE